MPKMEKIQAKQEMERGSGRKYWEAKFQKMKSKAAGRKIMESC